MNGRDDANFELLENIKKTKNMFRRSGRKIFKEEKRA